MRNPPQVKKALSLDIDIDMSAPTLAGLLTARSVIARVLGSRSGTCGAANYRLKSVEPILMAAQYPTSGRNTEGTRRLVERCGQATLCAATHDHMARSQPRPHTV